MRKPKLFVATGVLVVITAMLISIALLGFLVTGQAWLLYGLVAVACAVLCASVLITMIRWERQNQRVNRAINDLRRKQVNEEEIVGALAQHSDQLVARIERVHETKNNIPQVLEVPEKQAEKSTPRVGNTFEILRQTPSHSIRESKVELDIAIDSYFAPFETVKLSKSPLTIDVPLDYKDTVECSVTLYSRDFESSPKAAIISATVLNDKGQKLDYSCLPSHSDTYGYFQYLNVDGLTTVNTVTVSVPRNATKLRLSLYSWAIAPELQNCLKVITCGVNRESLSARKPREIKVAAILDEFSYNSFKFECDMIALSYKEWKKELERFQPDLFLCESAWSGADSVKRPWKGRIYCSENFSSENRGELLKILDYCKEQGIPTVFWNKEDPSHYDDKKHNFVDTALKFDHIFTTDENCVARYKSEYGHPSVNVLPFAVQPRLFNPIVESCRTNAAIFAGGWYSNHEKRSQQMEEIFDSIEASGTDLKIYDRFYGSDDVSHRYPKRFVSSLNPSVPGDEMGRVYKESTLGLTINTVTDSPTMFARRIFELMACNTFVLSNYSEGVHSFFGDNVLYLDKEPDGLLRLTDEKRDKARAKNLHLVLAEHTYRERFKRILEVSGIPHTDFDEVYPLVVRVSSFKSAESAFKRLRNMGEWSGVKVILLDSGVSDLEYATALTDFNRDGVRLVYSPLILDGSTELSEIFCDNEIALLTQWEALENQELKYEMFADQRLHAQYVDVPIVISEDSEELSQAEKYTFSKRSSFATGFVKPSNLKDLLRHLSTSTPATVYNV